MKEITITLPDKDAGKFVAQLMDMCVTFTVRTTVATDPLVLVASESHEVAIRERKPEELRDPDFVQRGLKGAKTGTPVYTRKDRPGRRTQRLTPDGHTSMEVVEAKIRSLHGRRFDMRELDALATYSGFSQSTIRNQLQTLVGRGKLVKFGKWTLQAAEDKRASPLPNGSSGAADLEHPSASSQFESAVAQ